MFHVPKKLKSDAMKWEPYLSLLGSIHSMLGVGYPLDRQTILVIPPTLAYFIRVNPFIGSSIISGSTKINYFTSEGILRNINFQN